VEEGKLPPLMGWSTWNQFHQNISEALVLQTAEAMKESGLLEAGYRYINLDDCWQASGRGANGRLNFDAGRFPGKEGLIGKLNLLGFKAGIYSSCGEFTCEDMPGSYGYEEIDARTWAMWGIEFLKYDYCHIVDLETDPHFNGNGFAADTPPVLYVGISLLDGGNGEIRIPASNAEITSPASLQDGAITGLCCPRASARFMASVPVSGKYQVSIGYVKERSIYRQFAMLAVDGGQMSEVWFPRTSGWNNTARVTVNVALNEGLNTLLFTNPLSGQKEDSIIRYTRMGNALKQAARPDKPIFFSICEHGRAEPWTWAGEFAGSWRVSGDINPSWAGVMHCYETAAGLWEYQKPGAYNDPDMLEVGVSGLTDNENLTHFALWCMLSAPLVLSMDIRKITEKENRETLSLVKNPQLIAINQDPLLLQASRTSLNNGLDLLEKPLFDGSCAVCVFNKTEDVADSIALNINEIILHAPRLSLREDTVFQAQNVLGSAGWVSVDKALHTGPIKPHGIALFFVRNYNDSKL
jgi:hypothetical protein